LSRLFFITDVHAPDRCFRKFLNAAKVYKADCLNPGSEYADGILRGALVNLVDGKVKEFQLTSGWLAA